MLFLISYFLKISTLYINNLYCWIYCSYTLHTLFQTKITLFCLFSFVFIHYTTRCQSLSLFVTCCITRCHSLSFFVTLCTTRCNSLLLVVALVVTRCHSLSPVVPLAVIRCHSLSFAVTRCTTRLSFYKRSY